MILDFIASHTSDLIIGVILFFLVTAKLFPPQWVGGDKEYTSTEGKLVRNPKMSIIDAVTNFLFYSMLRNLIVVIALKGSITLVMFAVIVVELVATSTISTNAVIVASIGILALYLETMVEKARRIKFFKIFEYESKD